MTGIIRNIQLKTQVTAYLWHRIFTEVQIQDEQRANGLSHLQGEKRSRCAAVKRAMPELALINTESRTKSEYKQKHLNHNPFGSNGMDGFWHALRDATKNSFYIFSSNTLYV